LFFLSTLSQEYQNEIFLLHKKKANYENVRHLVLLLVCSSKKNELNSLFFHNVDEIFFNISPVKSVAAECDGNAMQRFSRQTRKMILILLYWRHKSHPQRQKYLFEFDADEIHFDLLLMLALSFSFLFFCFLLHSLTLFQ
jgi:hypothetical protein